MARPYSIGFHGHAHICDCEKCAQSRAARVVEWAKTRADGAEVNPDKTVFVREYTVRAHFRRNERHLSKFHVTQSYVRAALTKLSKKSADQHAGRTQ